MMKSKANLLAAKALIGLACALGWMASATGQQAAREASASRSIVEEESLKLEYQAGKAGFPTDRFAYSTALPKGRATLLKRKSTALALVDEVPYSAKAHVTARFGANVFEAHAGPIMIGSTYLLPYDDTIVFGADAFLAPIISDGFKLQFGENTRIPTFGLLLKRRGAPPLGFLHGLAEEEFRRIAQGSILALSQVDPLLSAADATTLDVKPLDVEPETATTFAINLATNADAPVESVYLIAQTSDRDPIVLDYAGFVRNRPPNPVLHLHTSGVADDGAVTLALQEQSGRLTTIYPDSHGNFVFARPEGPVFSAVFRTTNDAYYIPAGRWFSAKQEFDPEVLLRPDYVNPGGQVNDLDAWRRSIRRSRLQTLYSGYAPHTRAWWNGAANKTTRFFNQYFYNNIGFHDIDVLPQNSDQCRVGVYFGESLVEARQVRLFERSVTLLSEKLSLALQRCVIVHPMAPGKTVQSYEDIVRLEHDIKPNFVMFEVSPSIFMYLTPEFQRHFFGYTEGQSPASAFKFDKDNRLKYLAPSPKWIEHIVPANPILKSGGQIGTAFITPERDAPPEANEAWRVLEAMILQYKKEFPATLFVLDGAYEGARCAAQEGCPPRALPSVTAGGTVSGGPAIFEQRLREVCNRVVAVCSVAPTDKGSVFDRAKIYENDFHYTAFGNYWLAETLARDLAGPLARQATGQLVDKAGAAIGGTQR